ncbi:glycosyltransferase [Curtobacterium sp. ZW137]|uniref:glycosyltransferase n=1 Tax=Curtobacterium sp. ZW137 TaxID=2485104 RepID=UPI000F4BE899|nr:glycosyltransferase [Curtobacterium sp. ZW137]ROP65181.1 glycosyltransferase involved in cell wall biosynthesis [Curtobacterium sp. ZW137]
MPTLLSYLNVSNASNLQADSGFVFQESLLAELRELGWDTVLVGPPGIGAVSASRTIEIPVPQSKYGVRYGMPWDTLDAELAALPSPPDALLVNQPELAVPLLALVSRAAGHRVPMGVYFHYVPVQAASDGVVTFDPSLDDDGLAASIWTRQVEAACFADVAMIGSTYGRDLFLAATTEPWRLADRFAIVPPPRTAGDEHHTDPAVPADPDEPVTLLYNHRLYAHYGTAELTDRLEALAARRPGAFRVVVTNPTGERSAERRRLDPSIDRALDRLRTLPFVEVVTAADRATYERVLARTDIALGPLRENALWNMAIVDAMAHGAPVVAYDRGAFPEIVGDPSMLHGGRDEFLDLLAALIDDPDLRRAAGARARARTREWEPARIARQVAELLSGSRHRA